LTSEGRNGPFPRTLGEERSLHDDDQAIVDIALVEYRRDPLLMPDTGQFFRTGLGYKNNCKL
jgi:hypothetical protein